MSKLKLHIILVLALWLALSGVAAAEQLYVNESGWWRDGGAFNASTAPIQAAVDAAGGGDAIYVEGGIYDENVDVDKPRLTLEGEGADVVTVTAASTSDVFAVTADWVNISGFTVKGATCNYMAGIYLNNVDYCNISENNVYGNYRGIYLRSSSNSTLTNNTASNNNVGIRLYRSSNNNMLNNTANSNHGYGIHIESSSNNNMLTNNTASNNDAGIILDESSNNNMLTNNTASNNAAGINLHHCSNNTLADNTANSNSWDGIYMECSSNNTLANNTLSGNRYNFGVSGSSLSNYIQHIDTNNTVNGKPIYYWVDQHDQQIPSDAGYVGIVNSTNITVKDLTLTNNGEGVLFACTINSQIVHNTASNNDYGIYLYGSSNNTFTNNTANSNNDYGIYMWRSSNNNMLTNNTANSNGDGIYMCCSSNNTLANNTANSNKWNGIDLEHSSNNTLANNTLSGNRYNFGVSGSSLSNYIQHIDTNNTVNGKSIYYWVDQHDQQIPSDAGYVGIVNSTNITVKDLTLTNNGEGVLFACTINSQIVHNTASNNRNGIYLYGSSNNTLANNTASNSWDGIILDRSSNNRLVDNTANSNGDGIDLEHSSNNTLANNTASNNDYGIYLYESSNNTLANNTASNNEAGIIMDKSINNTLANNTLSGNRYNFGVYGSSLSNYIQHIDTNNTVNGKPIYYWVDQHDQQIPSDAGYVGIVNSTNITVKNLTLTNNGEGVLFAYTMNSQIVHNTASNNRNGIQMSSSSVNTLENNTASNNGCGIRMSSSNCNILSDNNVSCNNNGGVYIFSSNSNTLQGNTANSNDHGIYLSSSNGNNITCNLVQNNELGFYISNSIGNNISYNNIIENGNYNATSGGWEWQSYMNQYQPVEAKHNYWGAGMNNSTIDASIYDYEEGGWGEVEFYPFETESVPCAPTPEEPYTFTTTDAVIALQIAVGSRPSDLCYDVSGDKRVTSLDALMILQAAAGGIAVG